MDGRQRSAISTARDGAGEGGGALVIARSRVGGRGGTYNEGCGVAVGRIIRCWSEGGGCGAACPASVRTVTSLKQGARRSQPHPRPGTGAPKPRCRPNDAPEAAEGARCSCPRPCIKHASHRRNGDCPARSRVIARSARDHALTRFHPLWQRQPEMAPPRTEDALRRPPSSRRDHGLVAHRVPGAASDPIEVRLRRYARVATHSTPDAPPPQRENH